MVQRKRSSKTALIKKWNYYIVNYIKDNNKLPSVNLPKSTFQHRLNKLKLEGIITKIGYSTWVADSDKLDQLYFKKEVRKQHSGYRNIRGHGFHYKIDLPNIPNWRKRKEYLDKKNILYTESKANWKGYKIVIKGYKCWLLNNSIIIYTPKNKSFYNYSAKESLQMAFIELFSVIKSIEYRLRVDLTFNNKYRITVCKQHFAKVKDALANHFNNNNLKLNCFDDRGELWLLVDKSLNFDELEMVHSKTAKKDTDKVTMPFFNDLKRYNEKTGQTLVVTDLLKALNNQVEINTNLSSSIEALQNQINSLIYKKPEKLNPRDTYFG